MPLTEHTISGELRDADGNPLAFGTVTFVPVATHDARVDGASALLGFVQKSIKGLGDVSLTEGGWRITIATTSQRQVGAQRRPAFATIVRELDVDQDYTWGQVIQGAVSEVPITPSLLAQMQTLVADTVELQDGAMALVDADPDSDYRQQADARLMTTFASGQVDVTANGVTADGTTDDTAAWNAILAATAAIGATAYLRGGLTSKITAPLTPPDRTRVLGGPGATIAQATVNKPAFDLYDVDDVTVQGLTLTNTATRTYLATTFRGSAGYIYSAGVWANGERNTFRDLTISNFTSAIYLTSWDGADFNQFRAGNVIDNVKVSSVDFGLLAVGQDSPVVSGLVGSFSLTSASPNPPHLIYWSDGAVGTSASRDITVANCQASSSSGGHAYQFKGVTSGRVTNMGARGCAGLFSVQGCQDMEFVGFTSLGDVEASNNGAIYVQSVGTEARLRFANGNVQMATADNRAARLDGVDSVLENVHFGVVHATVGSSADITVQGTRCRVENVKVVNSNSSGGWYNVSVVAGSGHVVRGVSGINSRGGVQINSGVTDCKIEVDGGRFTPPTAYTGLRVLEDNNTTAPVSSVTWATRRVAYSQTGGTIPVLPANANFVDITITGATALTIANPPTYQRSIGQPLTVAIYNSTAGAMGSTTLSSDYETASAFSSPAAGARSTLTFMWNGSKWREIARAA